MKTLILVPFVVTLVHSSASAQVIGTDTTEIAAPSPDDGPSSVKVKAEVATSTEYVPMTMSERGRKYVLAAFGPSAIVRAAATAGIAQWEVTPKEWRVGAEAYGDRFGNVMAQHVIREALEFGGSAALKEDNRYFRSTDSGFFKRSKHAIRSVFVARNEAGGEHFAYSRFGSVIGSSFISRLWQPPSENTAGDAAVSFGLTMAADIGGNLFKEFAPKSIARRLRMR